MLSKDRYYFILSVRYRNMMGGLRYEVARTKYLVMDRFKDGLTAILQLSIHATSFWY